MNRKEALFTINPPPSMLLILLTTFKTDRALSELDGEFTFYANEFLAMVSKSIFFYIMAEAISYLVCHFYLTK